MKTKLAILLFALIFVGCKNDKKEPETETTNKLQTADTTKKEIPKGFKINPVSHATMVLTWNGNTIYVDPVGGGDAFSIYEAPDLILVTDIHGDHLNVETLAAIITPNTKMIVPKAVADKLPEKFSSITVLNNGEAKNLLGFTIEAIPMYNLRTEALQFHEKGRGNGYVIEGPNRKVYISGDTEDIPEMRSLEGIDIAFVCMNLPYTMPVESAADAVLEFQPKIVYPYHYRGSDGFSDVKKFKQLVNEGNNHIIVTQLDWYKNDQ